MEAAWAAGFWDGEGCCNSYLPNDGRRSRVIQASVSQIHAKTLERFNNAVGGIGKLYGPYKWTKNDIFTLKFSGHDKVISLYEILKPFLSEVKIDQFEKALVDCPQPIKRTQEEKLLAKRKAGREWAARNRLK